MGFKAGFMLEKRKGEWSGRSMRNKVISPSPIPDKRGVGERTITT